MTWKQVECPFEEDRAILHYLHTAPVFSEDGENLFVLCQSEKFALKVFFILVDCLFFLTFFILHQVFTWHPMRVKVQRTR